MAGVDSGELAVPLPGGPNACDLSKGSACLCGTGSRRHPCSDLPV